MLDNETLNRLLLNIHLWQERVTDAWIGSVIRWENTGLYEQFTVIDHLNRPTGIPPFEVFNELWTKADMPSPLEFNWQHFEGDALSMRFLENSLKALNEQVDLWRAGGSGSLLYWGFSTFVERLNTLFGYMSSLEIQYIRTLLKYFEPTDANSVYRSHPAALLPRGT